LGFCLSPSCLYDDGAHDTPLQAADIIKARHQL